LPNLTDWNLGRAAPVRFKGQYLEVRMDRNQFSAEGAIGLAERASEKLRGPWNWNKIGIGVGAAAAVAGAAAAARSYFSSEENDDFQLRLEKDENMRLISSSKVEAHRLSTGTERGSARSIISWSTSTPGGSLML
jgi:hypothetical protein